MARLDLSRIIRAIRDVAVGNRRARVIAAHIADAIPTRGTVLDAACGDGAVALALVQLRPDLVVVGADGPVRPDARIAVTPHDGIRIPYADGAFDYVLLVDRLLGFGDPAAFLAEAARVSRQGVVLKDQLGDGVLALPSLRLLQLVAGDAPARVDPPGREDWQAVFYRSRMTVVSWVDRLGLFVPPFDWVFGRRLHFVARLSPRRG